MRLLVQKDWKPGDLPPTDEHDYLGWHAWADVQRKAGIKQVECCKCGKWRTPQELNGAFVEWTGKTNHGREMKMLGPVCSTCAESGINPDEPQAT